MPFSPQPHDAVALHFSSAGYTPKPAAALVLDFGAELNRITLNQVGSVSALGAVRGPYVGSAALSASASVAGVGVAVPGPFRGITGFFSAPWGEVGEVSRAWQIDLSQAPKKRNERAAGWNTPPERSTEIRSPWNALRRTDPALSSGWQPFAHTPDRATAAPWAYPAIRQIDRAAPWGELPAVDIRRDSAWRNPPAKDRYRSLPWRNDLPALDVERILRSGGSTRRDRSGYRIPWERGHPAPFVYPRPVPAVIPTEPPEPPHTCYTPAAFDAVALRFAQRLLHTVHTAVPLAFLCDHGPQPIPIRSVYLVTNTATLVRLPDRTPIVCTGMSFETDIDSWSWSFRAAIPRRADLDLIAPGASGPVAVEATINGYTFTALVEGYSENRRFPSEGFTVQGRSLAAELAAPYATPRSYIESQARTANQLADQELAATGWTLDWNTVDWLIPAGAWSYGDDTPMSAILKVAGAVGAVVTADRALKILRARPRYPVSPWAWNAAPLDAVLPIDLVTDFGLGWKPNTLYRGVYASGQNQGVLVNVKRAGTDGVPYQQMIVDPLITHADAGRERGRIALASSGNRAEISLTIPLFPDPQAPGLIEPGALIEVQEASGHWRALVTACTVDVKRSDRALIVTQNLSLDRYHGA